MEYKIKYRFTPLGVNQIRLKMEELRLSLRDLERTLLISHQVIGGYLKGDYGVNIAFIKSLENVLSIKLDYEIEEARVLLNDEDCWRIKIAIKRKLLDYAVIERALGFNRGSLRTYLNGRIAMPKDRYDKMIEFIKNCKEIEVRL